MNRFILLLAFLIAGQFGLITSHSYSQTAISDTIKRLPQINKEFLVVAHLVLNESGEASSSASELSIALGEVTALFQPIGVSFRLCKVDSIANFQYDKLNVKKASNIDYLKEIYLQYYERERINIFVMSEFLNDFEKACGFASLGGIASTNLHRSIVLKKGCVSAGVLGHEMGHFFNLPHTFEKDNGLETVNGSNCDTAGDGVCDTPADPYEEANPTLYFTEATCEFIYTQKDANGQYYDPDLGNIMSYYGSCTCLKFSNGQYEKMARQYLSNPTAW